MTPKQKAWQWCSKYIRLRDAIEFCEAHGIDTHFEDLVAQCCTCGVIRGWRYMDAGHFIGRGLGGGSGVYFDERNIHDQCKRCNGFLQGNTLEYRKFMLKKYGERVIEELEIKDKIPKHCTTIEYEALAVFYKEAFKELRKSA